MEKQYFKEVDILRGIAIFLVLLGHAIIVFPIDLHEITWCNLLFIWLSTVHMPLFFVISGFCYSSGNHGYGRYLLKKVKRLLVPYFVFGMFGTLLSIAFPGAVNHQRNLVESVKSLILSGGGYWFLYVLFLIFVIFPLLEAGMKKFRYFSVGLLLVLLLIRFLQLAPGILTLNSVCNYLFFFILGYLLRTNIGWRQKMSYRVMERKLVLLVASGIIWGICVVYLEGHENDFIKFLAALCGLIVMYIVAKMLADRRNYLLCQFSKYSLPLYLMNGYLLVVSRTIIVSKMGFENPVIIIGFNMFVTLICSWLFIKYFVDKLKPIKFLFGMG